MDIQIRKNQNAKRMKTNTALYKKTNTNVTEYNKLQKDPFIILEKIKK